MVFAVTLLLTALPRINMHVHMTWLQGQGLTDKTDFSKSGCLFLVRITL